MSVADAGEAFAGEWVLMEITGYDAHGSPALGRVVAHGSSNRSVCRLMDLALAGTASPLRRHYLFLAPRRPAEGVDLRSVFTALGGGVGT